MPDSRRLSLWFLHWVFRVVILRALLGPPRFDIFISGIHKTQAHIKIPTLLGLDYYTVVSSIITVKLQNKSETAQHSWVSKNRK